MSQHRHDEWGTRVGVILAVAGSAVGLGNFLRFPGQAAANGGGAFMIPYFCALLLLGIPVGWVEWTLARHAGRHGFHSAPGVLGVAGGGSFFRHLGAIGVLIPLVVSFYYVFIEAWCLGYTFYYLTGGVGIDAAAPIAEQNAASGAFYTAFTGAGADGVLLQASSPTLWFWLSAIAFNVVLVYRGISGGIEKFCNVAMPVMAVCALVVLIRVLTLGTPDPAVPEQSVLNGLGYMWNPDFTKLGDASTWLAAAGQIFFSLSVGFGIIINYASYLKKDDDVVLSGLASSATNELFEVGFGGMITLTASFVFLGLAGTTAAVQTGTFGLGFNTLPVVFAHMGAVGNLVGVVWFFMLFLAALTSSVSMVQPAIAFFMEALGVNRPRAVAFTLALGLLGGGLTLYFTEGGAFWSTLDFWVGTFLIFVIAAVEVVVFGWVFGVDRGLAEAHRGSSIRIPGVFRIIIKYVAPVYLGVVFLAFCIQNLGDSLQASLATTGARTALIVIVLVMCLLLVVTRMGERRWRAAGLDLDGRQPLGD
ncbi:MAG: sodium:calcium symporter [Vicinamibacterales bacterium]